MEEIRMTDEKWDFYDKMLDKWANRIIETPEDRREYIVMLKTLLDENEEEMEFEVIIDTVKLLTGCVDLVKFRPYLFPKDSK